MSTKPLPYQKEGVRIIREHGGRSLVADEMGLGKSFQSLLFRKKEKKWKSKRRPTVIICPAALKYNWEAECITHINRRPMIAEGTKAPKKGLVQPKILIINYEILKYWLPYIRWMKPELVIIDEAHRIKNTSTQAYKNVRLICNGLKVPYVLPLSGTPLINQPYELWPTLNLVWPDKFPNQWKFGHKYCRPVYKPWGWVFKGARNLPKLHRLLKKYGMVRRLKSDVMDQLPPIRRVVVPLTISNYGEYERAVNEFAKWLRAKNPNNKKRVERALKAEALVKVGYLLRLAAELKMPQVIKWLDGVAEETDGKVVLYGTHKARLAELKEKFGKTAVVVDGSVTGRKRQGRVDLFKNKKKRRWFIGNMKAASTGFSLPAAIVAFFEMAWTPVDHLQGEGRCHGVGRGIKGVQTTAYYLVARGTIEERLCELIQEKFTVAKAVLDGNKETGDDFDIFDKLLKEVEQWKGKKKRK